MLLSHAAVDHELQHSCCKTDPMLQAALLTLDAKGLDVENLEALSKAVPTDDECQMVKLFLAVGPHCLLRLLSLLSLMSV